MPKPAAARKALSITRVKLPPQVVPGAPLPPEFVGSNRRTTLPPTQSVPPKAGSSAGYVP